MIGKIVGTFIYPIKGMHGIDTFKRGLMTDTERGVLGDRTYALFRKKTNLPTEWKPKGMFKVCMNTEGMAISHRLTENDLDHGYRPNLDIVQEELERLGLQTSEVSLVDTGSKFNFADNNKPYVSFLNLASVRDLEQATGLTINPHRFRMNVWVDGLEPWAELGYIRSFGEGNRYPMHTNRVQFEIDNLCERCKAIEQDPLSGTWDMDLRQQLAAYLQYRGYEGSPENNKHIVMGWYAIPKNNGSIRTGENIFLG